MGILDDRRRQRGVQIYDPVADRRAALQRQAPQVRRPAPNFTGSAGDRVRMALAQGQQREEEQESDDGNPFGRGLGFIINNPVTQVALKPLQYLDYGRRAVTLGMEELAEGITGQELKATEGDTRSNWEKLKDPEYGVGQLLGGTIGDITPWEWDDQWLDRAAGFVGDVAFDPLSYVGGIGIATKGMAAGGRSARLALASRALNQARRAGASPEEIADLTARLQQTTRRGLASTPEIAEQVGARGGVRLTSNPFSPYRGAQVTIPGSERATNALSRARTAVGDKFGDTTTGRRLQSLRTPKGLEPAYDRAFHGLGEATMEAALDDVNLYQKARRAAGAFSRPLTASADRAVYESRNMPQELKAQIIDSLETEGAKLSPEAKRIQSIFDTAWERATKQYGLPLRYRQRYAPHILTRDAMEWRRNPENTGKIVAPNGFFTEARYDPSGVTMARQFKIGDEFVVNGTPIKIEKGTVREINEKFRKAGLNFDFFESDPGIVAQKYINMLSDDVGQYVGARQLIEESGGRALVRDPAIVSGRAVDQLEAQHIIRGGGKEALDTDLETVARQLGVDLDPEVYGVRVDKEATKGVNVTTVLQAKKKVKELNQELKDARTALDTRLRQIAKGDAGWPGAPSLKADLRVRQEMVEDLAERAKQARELLSEKMDEQAVLVDRVAWHSGVVQEIDDELKRVNFLIDQIQDSAPKEVMADLQAQRRVLQDQFEKSRNVSERARQRIARRTEYEGSIDNLIDERRAALYEAVGAQQPQSGLLPGARTDPIPAEFGPPSTWGKTAPYPAGRQAAELENKIANALLDPGGAYKDDLKRLSKLTGSSEDEILDELARRGVDVSRARGTSTIPERTALKSSVEQARQEVLDESGTRLTAMKGDGGPPPGPTSIPGEKDLTSEVTGGRKFLGGEWDALKQYYSDLQSNRRGQAMLRKMREQNLIGTNKDKVGLGHTPDGFAQRVSEAVGRDVSVDEAFEIYFREAERYINALPKRASEVSDEVAERAAQAAGVSTDLVRASQSPEAYKAAVQAQRQQTAQRGMEAGRAVREAIGQDEADRIAGFLQDIVDATPTEQRAVLLEEIEDALQRAGLNPNDYMEDLYQLNTPSAVARSMEEPPLPATAAPTAPAKRPINPREYDELSALRAQRKAIIDEANSVPGLRRANQEIDQRIAAYIARSGVTEEDIAAGYMAVRAKLDARKQALADRAQELAVAGDERRAKALIGELRDLPADEARFLDEYDRLTAKRIENINKAADIEGRAGDLKAQADALTAQIDERSADIVDRLPKQEVDPNLFDRQFRRLLDDEQTAAMRRAEQQPTVGKGATPNLEGTSKGYNLDDSRIDIGVGRQKQMVDEPSIRQALQLEKGKVQARINGTRRLIKDLRKKVDSHPRVQRAKAKVTRASINQGATRRGKIALPERPGKVPKNLKDFPDWDEATRFWNEQVDAIIEGRPIQGGPEFSSPVRVAEAQEELEQVVREISEAYNIPARQAELDEAIEQMSSIRTLLDKKVFVGDDPKTVEILSRQIRETTDPGELESLRKLERETVSRQQQAGRMNEADAAIARREVERRAELSPQIIDVEDQIDELADNPQAAEALRREAMDQPEARRVVERKQRLESESNASKAIAAASEAKLGSVERSIVETQAELADIYAGQVDAAKLAGQARGRIARMGKLNPENRGKLKVEEFLQSILDTDPGLRNIDNQATVFAILKAEDDAEAIKGILARIEDAKLSGKGDHLSRVVDVVLEDTWKAMMPDIAGVNGPIIHRDLARMHNNVKQITRESNFWRHVDTLTGLFKTYATLTPGFHVRNALSAAFMNASDGVPVNSMRRSVSVMREYGQAAKQGDEAIEAFLRKQGNVVLNEETGATMMDALDAAAGTGIGGRYREHGVGDRSLARNRATEKLFENRLTHWVGKTPGTFVESSVRLPATIDTLVRGGTVDEAVMRATRLHFDYSEVSQFDEKMRRLIPFWTFMSRNLPLQLSQMYTNPRAYAKYNSFIRNAKGTPEENEPEYFSKIGAFRLGDLEIGGLPIYLQPDLQHTRLEEDVEKLEDLVSLDNPARALSDFNPLFTAPAEYISNQNFYTGRRYDENDYRQTGIVEAPIAALARFLGRTKETPGGNRVTEDKFLEAFRSLIPVYDRSVRLLPQATTGGNDADAVARQIESMARLVGIPGRQLSPQQQQSEAMRRYYAGRDEAYSERALAALDK